MSTEVSVHRDVAAPADVVWALVSDVTRMGEWSPETTACSWKGGATGPAVGARFVGRNRNGRRQWSTGCQVVAADPGRSFAFEVTVGPLKVARWSYRMEPTDQGCRVTETWTDQRGAIAKLAGGPASGVKDREAHNRAGMEQTLERLAAAAEAAAADAT